MADEIEIPEFITRNINAKFKEFSIPPEVKRDLSVVVPMVKGTLLLKYGAHCYTFYNFRTLRGFNISISHQDIARFKPEKLKKAAWSGSVPLLSFLFKRFHNNFSFIEQIMMMTVPHTVTSLGNGKFLVTLWSYFGFLEIDCQKHTVTYKLIKDGAYKNVLGSQQYYDKENDELYYSAYSLTQSIERIQNADKPVSCSIFKKKNRTGETELVWSGEFADYIHDIVINKPGTYCALPELGMYTDKDKNIVPSRVLILDLKTKKTWTIDRFYVAAHAQFDPKNPDIIYFSNHNFEFEHTDVMTLLKKATYSIKFRGPASVFKYRLTPNGPEEIGMFTDPDFYRLTNFHVFNHRGIMIIAALGFPDEIYILDADKMSFIKKVKVANPRELKNFYSRKPTLIGTFSPSIDGEKLYVQTTRSFQVVDIATGGPDYFISHFFNRTASNHMQSSSDTDW